MYHDAENFRNFYYHSKLGRSTQRRVRGAIATLMPDAQGEVLAGFGFAAPYLRPLRGKFENVLNFMPAQLGAMIWPAGEKNISVLIDEGAWPVKAGVVDLAIAVHALEFSENLPLLLDEIWRSLTPSGTLILVVPNRTGSWANREITPFSNGRPFSLSQIEHQLHLHRFKITQTTGALYAPPWTSTFGNKTSKALEWAFAKRSMPALAGVLVLMVKKDFGGNPSKLRARSPIFALPDLVPNASRNGLGQQ